MKNTIYEVFVDYQDTDCGGVVYHSRYIDFAEKSRGHLFRNLELEPEVKNKYIWVVKSLKANYIKPAKLEDKLIIKTNIFNIKNFSLEFLHKIYINDELICEIELTLVALDKNFNFLKIDEKLKNIFKVLN